MDDGMDALLWGLHALKNFHEGFGCLVYFGGFCQSDLAR